MEDIIRKPDGTVVYKTEMDLFLEEGIDYYFKLLYKEDKKEARE